MLVFSSFETALRAPQEDTTVIYAGTHCVSRYARLSERNSERVKSDRSVKMMMTTALMRRHRITNKVRFKVRLGEIVYLKQLLALPLLLKGYFLEDSVDGGSRGKQTRRLLYYFL